MFKYFNRNNFEKVKIHHKSNQLLLIYENIKFQVINRNKDYPRHVENKPSYNKNYNSNYNNNNNNNAVNKNH